jgi:hypothetical protein
MAAKPKSETMNPVASLHVLSTEDRQATIKERDDLTAKIRKAKPNTMSADEFGTLVARRDALNKELGNTSGASGSRGSSATWEQVDKNQSDDPPIYPVYNITGMAARRVRAKNGHSEAQAIEEVFDLYRPLVARALAEHIQTNEKIEPLVSRQFNHTVKHRPAKQPGGTSTGASNGANEGESSEGEPS